MKKIREQLIDYLNNNGLHATISEALVIVLLLIVVIIIGYIVDRIIRKVLLIGFERIIRKSKTDWDDLLIDHKVFNTISHLAPILVIFNFLPS